MGRVKSENGKIFTEQSYTQTQAQPQAKTYENTHSGNGDSIICHIVRKCKPD